MNETDFYKDVEFKEKFIERYSKITDFEKFKEFSLKRLRRSIRVNTNKISVVELKKMMDKNWKLTEIPWCKQGFWIEHKGIGDEYRKDVGNTLEHSLGYIYVQEAASMIPPVVLDPKENEKILDMCASPGSKTTQIIEMMKNKGIVVSNDYKGIRLAPLGINTQRVGSKISVLTLMEGRHFKDQLFDRILVDAPCSGTGTISKSIKTVKMWNPNMIKKLAGMQRQLIETAFKCLKKDGTLVYSTCSCEPEENEKVVSFLVSLIMP